MITPDDDSRAIEAIWRILNDYGQECSADLDEIVVRVGQLMERVYNDDPADPADPADAPIRRPRAAKPSKARLKLVR